jgi:carbon monoxide dehydrogenase subunit G
MEMTGEQLIASPQELVWQGLNDPGVLKSCIAGCRALEPEGDSEYRIEMLAAVGPVKAKFKGRLVLSEIKPPTSYALSFEGSGGPAGFGKGTARVTLSQAPGGTLLSYSAAANIGGKLAQIGSRLIDGVAKKMADEFFAKFTQQMADYGSSMATPMRDTAAQEVEAARAANAAGPDAPTLAQAAPRTVPGPEAAAPAVAPQIPAGSAPLAGMVPIVAWVPAGSAPSSGTVFHAARPPIHPLWWIVGTAVVMVLTYLAFVRNA